MNFEKLKISREIADVISRIKVEFFTDEVMKDILGVNRVTSAGNLVYRKQSYRLSSIVDISSSGNISGLIDGKREYLETDLGRELNLDPVTGIITYTSANEVDKGNMFQATTEIKKFGKLFNGIDNIMPVGLQGSFDKNRLIEQIVMSVRGASAIIKTFKCEKIDTPSAVYASALFNHEDLGSCMSEAHDPNYSSRDYLDVYDELDECKALIFYKEDKPIGRCLLWKDEFFDRIYSVDYDAHHIISAFLDSSPDYQELANNQVFIDVTYLGRDFYNYPYMDGFHTGIDDGKGNRFILNHYAEESKCNKYNFGDMVDRGEFHDLQRTGTPRPIKKCIISGEMGAPDLVELTAGGYARKPFVMTCPSTGDLTVMSRMNRVTHGEFTGQYCAERAILSLDSKLYGLYAYAIRTEVELMNSTYTYALKKDVIRGRTYENYDFFESIQKCVKLNGKVVRILDMTEETRLLLETSDVISIEKI